jgi:hypothetical protein
MEPCGRRRSNAPRKNKNGHDAEEHRGRNYAKSKALHNEQQARPDKEL